MTTVDRAYRLLLRVYPGTFRERYEREMLLLVRDQQREEGAKGALFWAALVLDVIRSAPALWLERRHARTGTDIQSDGGTMMTMTMGILSILVGAMEMANALQEGWFGGMVNRDGRSLMAGTMVMVAGALLLTAGLALLRRAPRAVSLARGAAVTSLAVFAIIALGIPRMSVLATMLGTVFPVLLVIALYWAQRTGRSDPMIA